jgi:2-oxoglutarate ferredoxin oxidoreductase subunit alpha
MLDEIIGHMEEPIEIPQLDPVPVNPDAKIMGNGHRFHRTGLTHNLDNFLPSINPGTQEKLVQHLLEKVKKDAHKLVNYETFGSLSEAELIILCYGSESRSVKAALKSLGEDQKDVAMLRLITAWPFPKDLIQGLDRPGRTFLVAEVNAGQVRAEVERYVKKGEVQGLHLMGGRIHTPGEVLDRVHQIVDQPPLVSNA